MGHGQVFDALYAAQPAQIAQIRSEVVCVAAVCGADESTLAKIRLAVSEAATNVVLHAYRHDPGAGDVRVFIELAENCLNVGVRDSGIGMSPRADSPGAGLGLSLMANLADRCAINPAPQGGTEVILRFEVDT